MRKYKKYDLFYDGNYVETVSSTTKSLVLEMARTFRQPYQHSKLFTVKLSDNNEEGD